MARALRILLVDDDRDLAESVADYLEFSGYKVTLAHSGKEALSKYKETEFDHVLMDVRMPGMNGVESFLNMRKIRPDARVIMMTGYAVESLLRKARENGAAAVVYKPLAMDDLVETLEKLSP